MNLLGDPRSQKVRSQTQGRIQEGRRAAGSEWKEAGIDTGPHKAGYPHSRCLTTTGPAHLDASVTQEGVPSDSTQSDEALVMDFVLSHPYPATKPTTKTNQCLRAI